MPFNLIDEIRSFRKTRVVVGVALLAIGFVGLILPIIPGIVMIGLGLWLLLPQKADRFLQSIKKRFQ